MPDLEHRSGLSAETLAQLRAAFAATPSVARAWLYGSRARGRHRPGSDIDLAVEGTLSHTQTIQLLERLEALDLPYKIDLALLHEITDPALHAAIRREGLLLYEAETTPNPLHATQTR